MSKLNGSSGALTPVSELFAELIAEAMRAAELTEGDVDPTCGQALISAGYDRDFAEVSASQSARIVRRDGTVLTTSGWPADPAASG